MVKAFVERPVLAIVVTIFIVLLGVLGIYTLPVTQYPDIAPPTVQITTRYSGANAGTVMESVIIPIEEQVNGVEGMKYISSSAFNDGKARIRVFFEQGTDPDIAAVNVQNRVARANSLLPAEVIKYGVVTQKRQSGSLMFLSFTSSNEAYDDIYIQNFMNINIVPAIKRIKGVGDIMVYGLRDYAMRVWLDPARLAAYSLMPADIIRAINEQSREAAAGQLGESSEEPFQYIIRYQGRFNDAEEYQNIIIKTGEDGRILRLRDIAEVELSAFNYSFTGETNGLPSLTMAVFQTPGSNAQVIIEEIKEYLEEASATFPEGIDYMVNYDTNEFLEASIEKVLHTLFEAFILVFIVVFIFLQDFRSTLIPAITVPVSIVGSFFFLNAFGFSINLLTLFALILAIGIVVDDAIIVVEAVHAKLEKGDQKSVKQMTLEAMGEIQGTLVSVTLIMCAVFIPVTFIEGPTGIFYTQFGITLITAILISAFNALSLSPSLTAIFLKPHDEHETGKRNLLQKFYAAFNTGFSAFTDKYVQLVQFLGRHKLVSFLLLLICAGIIYWVDNTTPKGFVPAEDRGTVFGNIELPPGASASRTLNVLRQIQKEAETIPGISDISVISGISLLTGAGSNNGILLIRLTDIDKRSEIPDQSVEAIIGKLFTMSAKIPEARMIFFGPPSIPGFGVSTGFELQVLDKQGGTANELDQNTQNYLAALNARPEIKYAQTFFNTKYPQYELKVNVPQAKLSGVSLSDIFSVLSGYVGGIYSADFTKFGKQYKVMVQSLPKSRKDNFSLDQLFVRTGSGAMTAVSQFVSLERVYGSQFLDRFNLYGTTSVRGAPADGFSSGDAIRAVQEVSQTALPSSYGIDFIGLSREEIESGSQTVMIFILTLIFVYLLLAAQYESFVLPFAILLSIPFGIAGAYISQKLAGLENNIYFQIALIMLIGLLAKNAVLIVEFGLQRRKKGLSIFQAAIEGARARLRPILMTSFAFIFGLMPLVFASGVGAVGNRSLGTGAAFGLLFGTFLGVLVIPVFFIVFETIQEKIKPVKFDE